MFLEGRKPPGVGKAAPPKPIAKGASGSSGVGKVAVSRLPKTGPLSTNLKPEGKLMKAVAAAKPSPEAPAHHSLFSLHTLGEGVSDVANAATGAFSSTYKTPEVVKRGTAKALPLEKAQREGKSSTLSPGLAVASPVRLGGVEGTTNAFVKNPIGVTSKTIASLPGIANALASEGLRLGTETGLGVAKLTGAKVPKGEGDPLRAVGELAKTIGTSTVHTLTENRKEAEKEVAKEGAANQILTYAPIAGGAGAIAGRLLSKGVESAGIGAEDFAKVAAARDAAMVAQKDAAMGKFLEGGPEGAGWTKGAAPEPLSKAVRLRAAIHETAAEPRPNLRSAPGKEAPKVERGAAVKPQDRSPNFFRSAGQTALDNARRTYQLHGLERVANERAAFLKNYPDVADGSVPITYAQHLATFTKPGEVTPLFQKGGLDIGKFVGTSKTQRIGTSYPGNDLRRAGEFARETTRDKVQTALKDLSPTQRKLVVLAKEGHFPLHDPEKAQFWLEEVARQAREGSNSGRLIPFAHRMTGSDVAKQVQSALDEMKAKGAQSVITPDFQKLVEAIPDERLVSSKDPLLQQIPDEVAARKYLPQQQTLDAWAQHEISKHEPHADALSTAHAVAQIHQKLERGKELRTQAMKTADGVRSLDLHTKADNAFAAAKNLADENASRHGLPTDRAYIQHQRTRGQENWLHTIGKRAPSEAKKWRSVLQKQVYRSTDPHLIEDGILKSIRNKLAIENIAKFHDRFAVPGIPDKLTAKEAHAAMLRKGLNPEHFEVAHLGKVFHGILDRAVGGADMLHLDLDPLDHSKALGDLVRGSRGLNPADTSKGAQIYPKTALEELQNHLSGSRLANRAYGQAKGRFSSLMLGTNPGWATTMGAVTYPFQALMGGARPWDLPASIKWYKGLSTEDKRSFDLQTGTDSPFLSTHEAKGEKLGSATKALAHHQNIDNLLSTMKVFKESPFAKLLSSARPDHVILKLERIPRRYSRIAVATQHMKTIGLNKMLEEAKNVDAAQSKLQKAMLRLKTVGKMPSKEYMQEILKSRPLMEDVTKRTTAMMGEWQKMTNFERNVISKVPMFYPWVRYSLNLATKTLPQTHPLAYVLAGQLGVSSREEMRRLLGTDTPIGKAPIGSAQSGEPNEREYDWVGASQADPLLNQLTDMISGTPAGAVNALPPFIAAPIEYMMNRNGFTDKPLKRSEPYVYGSHEEKRPPFLSTMAAKSLEAFAPYRAALGLTAKGQVEAANALPWALAPMHYSPHTEQSIEEEMEARQKGGAKDFIGKYAIPLLPHREPGLLTAKLQEQEKQKAKEEQSSVSAGW